MRCQWAEAICTCALRPSSVKSREELPLASLLIWDWPRGSALGPGRLFAFSVIDAQLCPAARCRALAEPTHCLRQILIGAAKVSIMNCMHILGQKVSHSPASAFLAAFAAVIRAISIFSSSVFRGGRFASGGYVIY